MTPLFGRRAKRRWTDPVLGALDYDGKSSWQGRAWFPPLGRNVAVSVVTGGPEPVPALGNQFAELVRRYPAMAPAIWQALLDLYRPARDGHPEGLPDPASAEEMGATTELDWVEIEADGPIRLGYGFVEGAGWDDAMFTIRVVDGEPSPEHLDD